MRRKSYLCFLVLFMMLSNMGLVGHVSSLQTNGVISVPYSSNNPNLDGKWSTPTEWTDASENQLSNQYGYYGYVRFKYNGTHLFGLADFVSDQSQGAGDGFGICLDTLDDGGNSPKLDDYLFAYRGDGSSGNWRGTGMGGAPDSAWTGFYYPPNFAWKGDFNCIGDPYESGRNHEIYEFAIDIGFLGTTTTHYGMYMFLWDVDSNTMLQWPSNAGGSSPNMYNEFNSAPPAPGNWGSIFLRSPHPDTPYLSDFRQLFMFNNVTMIYPSDALNKPRGCNPAWVSDWAATSFVYTKLAHVIEGEDTDGTFVNQIVGNPLGANGTAIITFGGPLVNVVVNYAEGDTTPSADRAPIKWNLTGGNFYFQFSNGSEIPGCNLPASVINSNMDMFTIEFYQDGGGRYVMIGYGFGWKGTYAAGKYFETVIYPNMPSFPYNWIVVKWTDSNGNGFVNSPSEGDTYTVIAAGP